MTLGLFLVADRLILPVISPAPLLTYLSAITLALPINLVAVVFGKYYR